MNKWTTTYGITRVRGCCLFRWFEREGSVRTIEVRPDHCALCIAEVRTEATRRGMRLIERGPMRPSILVVDDDSDIRTGLASILEDEGYFTFQARDGQEAVTILSTMPRPSAALVDLMMPRMSGWQLISVLRGAGIPVIVITATNTVEVEGAAEIIRKPLSIDLLVSVLDRVASAA
jgi:CheY-like chemotaxis protein